jgi:hypothetical protein
MGGGTAGGAAGGTAGGAGGGTAGGAAGGSAGGSAGGTAFDAGYPPNYFVNQTTGSDSNPGTQALPWQTAAKVNGLTAAQLPPGSTVSFAGGQTWSERLVPPTSGDAGAPITFTTYGTGAAVFDGTGNLNTGLHVSGHAYLSFANLHVRNFTSSFCAYVQSVDHLSFTNLEIDGCTEGVHASPTGACDDVTMSGLIAHDFAPTPDGGNSTNNHGVNLPSTCNRWLVADSDIGRTQKSCVNDDSIAATWLRVTAHECGLAPSGTRGGFSLSGTGTVVRSCTVTNANGACLDCAGDGGTTLEANALSGCGAAGIQVGLGSADRYILRRNRIWNSDRGISINVGSTAPTQASNNSIIGGKVDAGVTQWAIAARSGAPVALENNLTTGPMNFALSVQGYDGGSLADGGPTGLPPGYVERSNWFDTSAGQLVQWETTVSVAEYKSFSGTWDAGSFFVSPMVASISPAMPDFTPGAAVRDTGVQSPASGALTMGCDAGAITLYCGANPEPGAVELIP